MNTEKLYRAILRNNLSAFTKKVFYTVDPNAKYMHNWHIDLISEYLQACQEGKIKRLIINIPPRYLKSISVNVAWVAWLLGHNPKEKILSSSYSQSLSVKHSIDTRLVMQSDWYRALYPNVSLVDDQNTKLKFVTKDRGFRMATATGSAVTGERGNFLIVDDALNSVDSNSEAIRTSANKWFDQAFSSRLNDKKEGVIVVIMQRLHEEDLTGHLLKKGGWELLKIPAENQTGEDIIYNYPISGKVKVFKPGEVLHEEREDRVTLDATKRELGSYAYAGQYLQEPAPLEGGMIKDSWWQWYDGKNRFTEIYQSWDTAIKEGQDNDYTVCTTWGVSGNQYYLIDIVREKLDYPALKKAVIAQFDKYNPRQVIIEDKASGQSLLQTLRKETKLPIVAVQPLKDKVTRLAKASVSIEAGRAYLPKDKYWIDDFLTEFRLFPNSKHDDIVDSVTQFINWYNEKPSYEVELF